MSMLSRWTIGAMASKKARASLAGFGGDRLGERGAGQRAGGDDRRVIGQGVDPLAHDRDVRMLLDRARHFGGEGVAVDRQRRAGGDAVLVRRAHDQRIRARASPGGAGRRHCARHRRSGSCSSRPSRPAGRSRAPGSCRRRRAFRSGARCSPASASCQAASDPASPPPMMWMSKVMRGSLVAVDGIQRAMRIFTIGYEGATRASSSRR